MGGTYKTQDDSSNHDIFNPTSNGSIQESQIENNGPVIDVESDPDIEPDECEVSDDEMIFDENIDMFKEWARPVDVLVVSQGGEQPTETEIPVTELEGPGDSEWSDTDYYLSDEDYNYKDPDDEVSNDPQDSFDKFDPKIDFTRPTLSVGKIFTNKEQFKEVATLIALEEGKAVKFKWNEHNRIRAVCKFTGCPWLCHLSLNRDKTGYQIKTFRNEHNCPREFQNRLATARYMARRYVDKFRVDPNWSYESFYAEVKDKLHVECSTNQFYRVRMLAEEMIEGNYREQYGKLRDYRAELLRTNPNSTVDICTVPNAIREPVFDKIYICLGGLKEGFLKSCRPVIGIDGCFLKGPVGGQLLTAVGIDGNNGMYPIAYAVVGVENFANWDWFISLLKDDLNIVNDSQWTIMSDKQKGLIDAVSARLPNAEHRHCVRHLYENMKRAGHKGLALHMQLWRCAKTSWVAKFEELFEEFKELDEEAWKWLDPKPKTQWTRSHFRTFPKCDILTNNHCESFNGKILRDG